MLINQDGILRHIQDLKVTIFTNSNVCYIWEDKVIFS